MDSGAYVIAVDGGGTKTIACLAERAARQGKSDGILGRGTAGPSNPQAAGFPQSLANLAEAVESAFAAAGLERSTVQAACLGVSGVGRAAERSRLEAWNNKYRLAHTLMIVHDAVPVLAAGTPEKWGVALIAGTGSFAYGRNADGMDARAGGWGYLFGDEGSGYALGVEALRAAARAADGRAQPTSLLARLLKHFGLAEAEQLIPAVYAHAGDRAAIAALAQHVLDAAEAGDSVAEEVLACGAAELAELVATLARRLGFARTSFPLAVTGGLLLGSTRLQRNLAGELARRGLCAEPMTMVHDPVLGAVRLAREAADQASN